jgi:tetratricopeptide (TPR) repeat protein
MNKILSILLLLLIFTSCNNVDFSKPELVIKHYIEIKNKGDFKDAYNCISTKSKNIFSFDEFSKSYTDSFSKTEQYEIKLINELDKDFNFPTYRRFRVEDLTTKDSINIKNVFYGTLINENGKWLIAWNKPYRILANEKFQKGDFNSAINLCNKALEIDPFDADATEMLAWSYSISDEAKNYSSKEETYRKISTTFKQAITLEPDISSHYNGISSFYNSISDFELSVEYLKKGLKFANTEYEKATLMGNIGLCLINLQKYDETTKYFDMSIKKIPKLDFSIYNKGRIFIIKENYELALNEFSKINIENCDLPNHLKGDFYFLYALALNKSNKNIKAKEFILKSLEINPTNQYAKSLYKQINQ